MEKLKCLKCDHEWMPRYEKIPEYCPKCKNGQWNEPRKRKRKVVKIG
jgi:hypothetical protein